MSICQLTLPLVSSRGWEQVTFLAPRAIAEDHHEDFITALFNDVLQLPLCCRVFLGYVGNGSCFLYDCTSFNMQLGQEARD